ncbi:hypothetical protein ACLOJK_018118 [Asimina triloba]
MVSAEWAMIEAIVAGLGEVLTADVAEDGKMNSLLTFRSALFLGWTPLDNATAAGIDVGDDALEKDVED